MLPGMASMMMKKGGPSWVASATVNVTTGASSNDSAWYPPHKEFYGVNAAGLGGYFGSRSPIYLYGNGTSGLRLDVARCAADDNLFTLTLTNLGSYFPDLATFKANHAVVLNNGSDFLTFPKNSGSWFDEGGGVWSASTYDNIHNFVAYGGSPTYNFTVRCTI